MAITITQETLGYMFDTFNKQYFAGRLPRPLFVITNSRTILGQFRCDIIRKSPFKSAACENCTIKISSYYDCTEQELADTLLHEMIHYSITLSHRRDTSPHGPLFRCEMARLNACGHNISIRTSTRHRTISRRNSGKPRLILAMTTTDGRCLLTVVSPSSRKRIDSMATRSPQIASHSWHISTDDRFASYPVTRSLRGRIVPRDEYDIMTATMTTIG